MTTYGDGFLLISMIITNLRAIYDVASARSATSSCVKVSPIVSLKVKYMYFRPSIFSALLPSTPYASSIYPGFPTGSLVINSGNSSRPMSTTVCHRRDCPTQKRCRPVYPPKSNSGTSLALTDYKAERSHSDALWTSSR